jgi:hypothetical protein
MTRSNILSLLAAIFIATAAAIPAWAEELHFDEPAKGWTAEHTRFIEALSATIKRINPFLTPRAFSTDHLRSILVDLNGDGVREMLVYSASVFFCGNSDGCDVSIYQKQETGWVYIGNIYQVDDVIFVEDHWVNGWRTLTSKKGIRADAYRYCWIPSTPPGNAVILQDMMGMPFTPGMAGYFGSSLIDEECPEVMAPPPKPK